MCGPLWVGAQHMDMLQGAQMATQEASGVIVAVMLQQQGVMREVSTWELEVEGAMWEMVRVVEEGEPGL